MAAAPIRVILYGVGGVGGAVARLLATKHSAKIVGAVDVDSGKVGRDVGALAGLASPLGVLVAPSLNDVLADTEADVAIHASVPQLDIIVQQLKEIVEHGLHAISVSGAFHVATQHPQIAAELHDRAKSRGVSIFSTGATPGFFPDTLPLFLTGICQSVERIGFSRVVDMGHWGAGLYKTFGIGLTSEAFSAEVAAGRLKIFDRLAQSRDYLAAAMGWTLDDLLEERIPRTAPSERRGNQIVVPAGRVCGFTHRFTGRQGGRARVQIDYTAIIGVNAAEDGTRESTAIEIEGQPSGRFELSGPVVTDPKSVYICTAAQAVNALPHVIASEAGLLRREALPLFVPIP